MKVLHQRKQETTTLTHHHPKVLLGITALALITAVMTLPHRLSGGAQVEELPGFGIAAASALVADPNDGTDTAPAVPYRIAIPAIGVYTTIANAPRTAESWDVSHLGWQAGHLEGTAYPGQGSNAVLGAHRYLGVYNSAHPVPGPFIGIDRLQPGDRIEITAGGHVYVYAVTEQLLVSRHAVWVVNPTGHEMLTLLSCDTWNPETLRFEKRLVIRADLVEIR
ncbi:MAG: sortase [Anaerolineae bacterium]|nr:MAG: sortase [Anaerolineae bacterium]